MKTCQKRFKVKEIWRWAGILLSICMLAGCSATELEDRCFPMLAVVDFSENEVRFAYGFPQLSQKANTDLSEAKVDVPMAGGVTFASAVKDYNRELEKRADCNHLKVLVFGEDFLREEDDFQQMLLSLRESEIFPRNAYVCVTGDVGKLMKQEKSLPTDVGSYLEAFLQNHEPETDAELVNLGTLLDESVNHVKELKVPYITVDDDAIAWDGYYVLWGRT